MTSAVSMTGIRRRFGDTVALAGVDFAVAPGEVHALLGENGAGKTTLARILAGLDRPDAGTVVLGGEPVTRFEPRALRDRGVAMVQQHFTLVPTLSAAENLALARPGGRLRPSAQRMRDHARRLADQSGLAVRVDVPVRRLSVGERQRLEILRALDADARLLILDEPTAVLTDAESERLLAVCRTLAGEGRSIVIITHRLGEALAGCDRVTVLRAGRVVCAAAPVGEHSRESLAGLMVGTQATHDRPTHGGRACGPPRLQVRGAKPTELEVGAGEIVGIAGVDGNGQAELEELLAGLSTSDKCTVRVDSVPLPPGDARARVAAGVAYIASDRYRRSLAATLTVADNLELGRGLRWRPSRRRRRVTALSALDRWHVRGAGPAAAASTLSGGNAQKLVLARELAAIPRVIIAAYPTRGLDPEAARTVADRIVDAARDGAAVVWFGAELDELFAICDRIVVLSARSRAPTFRPPYDRAAIGLAMTAAS